MLSFPIYHSICRRTNRFRNIDTAFRTSLFLLPCLYLSTPGSKITYMLISTLRAESIQRFLQLKQIINILTTRTATLYNMLSKRLWILWSQKLRVVWQTYVYQTLDLLWSSYFAIGSMDCLISRRHVLIERRVLDAVAVDLSYVEIFLYFGNMFGWDAVGCSPYSWRS